MIPKKLIATALVTSFFSVGFSQLPSFQRIVGGIEEDRIYDFEQTSDGGYIGVGYTENGIQGSSSDALLIKFDQDGNQVWNKTYGGTQGEYPYGVAQTADGGYIFCGRTGYSSFIVRTDAVGDTLWTKSIEKSWLYDIIQTYDNGYLACGSIGLSSPEDEAFLLKLDLFGNVLWSKKFGQTGQIQEWFEKVIQVPGGSYLAAGSMGHSSFIDHLLLKVNSAGDSLWERNYTMSNTSFCNGLMQTTDGGFLLSGGNYDGGSNDGGHLMKVNSTGNIQWQQQYVGLTLYETLEKPNGELVSICANDEGNGNINLLHLTSTGGFLHCRKFDSFSNNAKHFVLTSDQRLAFMGNQLPPNSIKRDILIVKTDASGPASCNETPILAAAISMNFWTEAPQSPVTTVVPVFLSNLFYVTSLTFADSTLCSAVGIQDAPSTSMVSFYPNPCNDRLTITFGNDYGQPIRLQLFDLNMKIVLSCDVPFGTTDYYSDLSEMVDGIYLMQVSVGGEIVRNDRIMVRRD